MTRIILKEFLIITGVYVQRYKVSEAASRRISDELLLHTGPKASTEEYD